MNGARATIRPHEPKTDQGLRIALVSSLGLHVIVLVLALVGLPILKKTPHIPEPISVELVTMADVAQADKPPVDAPKPDKLDPLPPEKPPEPKTPPKAAPNPTPEPPKVDAPKPEPDKKPEVVQETPPEIDDAAPPKKIEVKPPKKPEPKKPIKKPEEQSINTLLKNLTKDKPQPKNDINNITDKLVKPAPVPVAATPGEIQALVNALRQQFSPCWNVQAGAAEGATLAVEIRLQVNQDGSVRDAGIMDQSRYNSDDRFRAAADSALRAVRDPRCLPLRLPLEKFDMWRDMIINFDPKDML
jgi:hypothetical protein